MTHDTMTHKTQTFDGISLHSQINTCQMYLYKMPMTKDYPPRPSRCVAGNRATRQTPYSEVHQGRFASLNGYVRRLAFQCQFSLWTSRNAKRAMWSARNEEKAKQKSETRYSSTVERLCTYFSALFSLHQRARDQN